MSTRGGLRVSRASVIIRDGYCTDKPVRVDLVESLKTSGKDCVFRITISGA